ncbi:MAG: Na+/H+ antiporter subunit E [Defluviitaleaceae bacterium]|nr:Na+/H+ antiporter subunit E [Defluviitaleaceae bacterium]
MINNIFMIFIVIALALIWAVLRVDFSLMSLATGLVISAGCLYYARKYLPLNKITDINFFRLVTYPFYLIGQVYLSGFYVIKIILSNARVDVVKVDTELKSETLRIILADSITLTPGSIFLDMEDGELVLIWLRNADDAEIPANAGALLKSGLEKRLLKAQKRG